MTTFTGQRSVSGCTNYYPDPMDVSVIIVNYNTTRLTRQCIRSVIEQTKRVTYEIIVVDNNSADRSIEQLEGEFPEAVFLLNKENKGFGNANNQGIAIANGKYIFLLNSDAYLLNDAIGIFYQFMEQPEHQKIGCCGGDLFAEDGSKQVSSGNFPSLTEAIALLGFAKLCPRYFQTRISSGVLNSAVNPVVVDYISGADMFIRKEALDQSGQFDPCFFLYFEETELSYRMQKAGYSSMLLPEAHLVHLEGGSQKGTNKQLNQVKLRLFTKSRTLFFRKCYGGINAFFMNCIYFVKAIIQFIFSFGNLNYLKIARIIITQHNQ